ncbi:glycosyltransferase [Cyanobium gracile]|uniref:Glycosyltransferase n=1 Tax=Cyanobium gracile UHCC 0281 TaxID=3110309 RepID=A0ABU5STS4_9CYAN|nr:glycosyltransferase [Cyanobium gracile]MEA5441883.1 glycosyltransferase [Cyanobium gracile UHCC 0281]
MQRLKIAIFTTNRQAYSETFIRAHINNLPFDILTVFHNERGFEDAYGKQIAKSKTIAAKLKDFLLNRPKAQMTQRGDVADWLQKNRPSAILAEFGPIGAMMCHESEQARIPLVVHFHGADASNKDMIQEYRKGYEDMFRIAKAIVVVSNQMFNSLVELGAPIEKIVVNTYGADQIFFSGSFPSHSDQILLSVGRFVEKKSPMLTILSFSLVVRKFPNAKLWMAGDGPLLEAARQFTHALSISSNVEFLGVLTPDRVREKMRQVRGFVQHSLHASNGDAEGTPVGIIEAQLAGLPVVSTRHAGIPDVVEDGKTGYLVEEGDWEEMAEAMLTLLKDPLLAGSLGKAARERALPRFTLESHIANLAEIIVRAST